jgi:hypothetical protein
MAATDTARTLFVRFAWLVLALLIAFGAAGIVAAMDHVPGTPSRPELTWTGDREALPALEASTARLERLSDEVEALGDSAREALAQVVAGDLEALNETIAVGTQRLTAVDEASGALESSLGEVPGIASNAPLHLSDGVRRRYDELASAAGLTEGLAVDWAAFTGRALDAARVTGLLARHDEETAAAARQGAAGHYKAALTALAKSDATLDEARRLRDALGATTDVTTLGTWIDRNGAYDGALRTLYQSLIDAKGRVTSAVRKAFAAEQETRGQLPGDTRGLVVIMAEIAQGGLNQAVIAIEEARGSLSAALDVQRQLQAEPTPSG